MNLKPERKGEIINASLRLIEKKGIQNLTTKNLAREVGITEPGLYRHFKNKQDLLASILEMFKKTASSSFDHIIKKEGTALQKISRLYSMMFRGFSKNPAITAVIFSEEIFQNNKKLSSEVYSIMEMTRGNIESIINNGKKRKEFPDNTNAGHLSLIIMGTFRLIVTRWRLSGRSFDLEKEGAALLGTLNNILSTEIYNSNKEGMS